MSKLLTSDNSHDKDFAEMTLQAKISSIQNKITRTFAALSNKAYVHVTSDAIWDDPVCIILEDLKVALWEEQQEHYDAARYHVFHCPVQMERRLIGRYDTAKHNRICEIPDYPSYLIPSLGIYARGLEWLLDGVRGSGRTHVVALCLLEKGLHNIEKRIAYYDTESVRGWGSDQDHMYNVLQNITWDIESLKTRYIYSRDLKGPYLGVSKFGATEVNLFR